MPSDGKGSLAQYVLSDAESKRIFEDEIVPSEIGGHLGCTRDPRDGSLAVLLVGQTGAGKTRTAPLLVQAMTARGQGREPVHLIADTYKTYHPAYAKLMQETPALASPATGPDARRWLAMACRLVVATGADCLVESACRHPADFQDLVRIFAADQGRRYVVRVALLAVPEPLSRLGILVRYHGSLPEARSRGLPLRLTPRAVHDASFSGLLAAARWLDDDRPAAEVVVLRRGQMLAYRYLRDSTGPSAVADALLLERRRPLSPDESRVAAHDLEAMRCASLALRDDRRAEKAALDAELTDIEQLLGQLEGEISAEFPDLKPFDPVLFLSP